MKAYHLNPDLCCCICSCLTAFAWSLSLYHQQPVNSIVSMHKCLPAFEDVSICPSAVFLDLCECISASVMCLSVWVSVAVSVRVCLNFCRCIFACARVCHIVYMYVSHMTHMSASLTWSLLM